MRSFVGEQLNTIAFPLGGIGSGTICLQGRGSLGNIALRHHPNYRNNPCVFSAISVQNEKGWNSKLLETTPASADIFVNPKGGGLGWSECNTFGLPRFEMGVFSSRFPFAEIHLSDEHYPLAVDLCAWSPFIPGDEDNSSLPVASLEYTFSNPSDKPLKAIYSFAAENFLAVNDDASIRRMKDGFILQQPKADKLSDEAAFAVQTNESAFIDATWIRGGWSFDILTLVWKRITEGKCLDAEYNDDFPKSSPGATMSVPFELRPGEKKTIIIRLSWYVPHSGLNVGVPKEARDTADLDYQPWYVSRYSSINAVISDWRERYNNLFKDTMSFTQAFYNNDTPNELKEAVAATLSVLKSPTVLRQKDGRLWGWEGSEDLVGSCHGSCTHVWNYQQALCNLFPRLERSLRETEFLVSQNEQGHQNFRTALPIQPTTHDFHAAADGQLGGIIKLYREWRISGDLEWMRNLYQKAKESLNYCIRTWDPQHSGVLKKAHHNTYDIEFWGADCLCSGFYLSALKAFCEMSLSLKQDCSFYDNLYKKGRDFYETVLFNGEYFIQKLEYDRQDLKYTGGFGMQGGISPEVMALLEKEGPRYQFVTGCLSDAVLGIWLGEISGLKDIVDEEKLNLTLRSIFKYNYRPSLKEHSNPQRPGFAVANEGGLLLCTWPHGGKPALPFVYSDEVWTGIEYQVASHLIAKGFVNEGVQIVNTLRNRYNGIVRNPFDEYECGHWYARSMASYGLIQASSGVRYDAVSKTLHVTNRKEGKSFLSTNSGFATVIVQNGQVSLQAIRGTIDIEEIAWDV